MENKILGRKKRICLVFCGGTIAMTKDPKSGALVPAKSAEELLSMVPEVKNVVDVDLVEVVNKDSTDMTSKDWTKIAIAIYERYNDYDGFVVTHGTDTMAYTGAALSFAFGNKLNKPIVLTGSQAEPEAIGTDAKFNLANAFRAVTADISEVMISFGHYVFRAVRTEKRHESDFNAFMSPAFPELAYLRSQIQWSQFARKIRTYGSPDIDFIPEFCEGVLNVRLNAGLTHEMIGILIRKKEVKGIIFESLGAANVPGMYIDIIKEAIDLNIPVLVTSPFTGGTTFGMGTYQTGLNAMKAGAMPTGDMTFVAATVKLMWILNQIEKKMEAGELSEKDKIPVVKAAFQKNYVGEITLEKEGSV